MRGKDERARGVIVKVLDLSALEAQALEFRQKTHEDCYQARVFASPHAVVEAKDGTLWTICVEGVMYPLTEDQGFEAQFHGSYYLRDESTVEDLLGRNVPGEIVPTKHTFDMMPFASVDISKEDLLQEYPVKEEMDLADFIRTFGSRLESNFWTAYDILTKLVLTK